MVLARVGLSIRSELRGVTSFVRAAFLGEGAYSRLLHLSLNFRKAVWDRFRSWMRTMNPKAPPSEAVVAQSLGDTLPESLLSKRAGHDLEKLIRENANLENVLSLRRAG